RLEAIDRVDERETAREAARKQEAGAWGEIVDDLEKGRPLIALPRATPGVRRDDHFRKVRRRLRGRHAVDAIRDHTHRHPAPVVADGPDEIGPRRAVPLAGDRADPEPTALDGSNLRHG